MNHEQLKTIMVNSAIKVIDYQNQMNAIMQQMSIIAVKPYTEQRDQELDALRDNLHSLLDLSVDEQLASCKTAVQNIKD